MVARDRARARKMPHNVAREAAFYSRKITVGKCLIQAADDIGVGRRWHGRSVSCHPRESTSSRAPAQGADWSPLLPTLPT